MNLSLSELAEMSFKEMILTYLIVTVPSRILTQQCPARGLREMEPYHACITFSFAVWSRLLADDLDRTYLTIDKTLLKRSNVASALEWTNFITELCVELAKLTTTSKQLHAKKWEQFRYCFELIENALYPVYFKARERWKFHKKLMILLIHFNRFGQALRVHTLHFLSK